MTVARLNGDVGMNNPSSENPFLFHPDLFENTRRGRIGDITDGPNPENILQSASPINDGFRRQGCVSAPPMFSANHISDVSRVFTNSATNHSDDPILPSLRNSPRE